MNLLLSCIGKRGYIADYLREALGGSGRIVGTSNTPWTPGFPHCDASYLMPDIASDEYPEAVLDVCRREGIDGLLSFFDPDVARLSCHIEEFRAAGVTPILPPPSAAAACFDKVETDLFLRANGFKTARTWATLEGARAALRSGEARFPLFLKPRKGFGSRNTLPAHNDIQLEAFFGLEEGMIAQECLTGAAINFDSLADLDGNVVAVVAWKKLLSRIGETERAETVKDQAVIEVGVRLGRCLGNIGPMDVDLFVEDGEIAVLEMNPRFGGGYPVSHLAGGDFPARIVRMIRGETVEPYLGEYREGVVMMKDNAVIGGPRDAFFQSLKISGATDQEG